VLQPSSERQPTKTDDIFDATPSAAPTANSSALLLQKQKEANDQKQNDSSNSLSESASAKNLDTGALAAIVIVVLLLVALGGWAAYQWCSSSSSSSSAAAAAAQNKKGTAFERWVDWEQNRPRPKNNTALVGELGDNGDIMLVPSTFAVNHGRRISAANAPPAPTPPAYPNPYAHIIYTLPGGKE